MFNVYRNLVNDMLCALEVAKQWVMTPLPSTDFPPHFWVTTDRATPSRLTNQATKLLLDVMACQQGFQQVHLLCIRNRATPVLSITAAFGDTILSQLAGMSLTFLLSRDIIYFVDLFFCVLINFDSNPLLSKPYIYVPMDLAKTYILIIMSTT